MPLPVSRMSESAIRGMTNEDEEFEDTEHMADMDIDMCKSHRFFVDTVRSLTTFLTVPSSCCSGTLRVCALR